MKYVNLKQARLRRTTERLFLAVLLIFTFTFGVLARHEMQTPLIDREFFFGNPEVSNAEISPDGKYIAFLKPYKGTRNIWVKGVNEPFESARPITDDARRPIPNFAWSADGKYILFVQVTEAATKISMFMPSVSPRNPQRGQKFRAPAI